jgi:tight adherence protein C
MLILIAIYIFIIASIFLILFSLPRKATYKLPMELRKDMDKEGAPEEKQRRPLYFTYLFLPINRLILSRIGRGNLSGKLKAAEINISAEEYLAIKELLALIGPVLVTTLLGRSEPVFIFLAAFFGFIFPDIILRKRIQKRKKAIVRALPEAIDLLTLCVEGGLDFMLGLNWVVERSPKSPLINEFASILHEVKVGKSRQQALRDMGKRLGIPEVSSFVNTVVHAERMGTSFGEVLTILSEEARRQRFQKGERAALQAPIKMLFPLILFILPVVGIIVGGPVLIQFLQGGFPKF